MDGLSWRHHALIQALLSRGPLKEEDFYAVFLGVSGKDPAQHQNTFNKVLLKINQALAYVQFELRACRNQYDGTIYYSVVNIVADEQSKLGSKYSVPQIAYYKGVIEAVVQDAMNQGSITSNAALNIRLENQVPNGQNLEDSQSHIPAAFKNFSMTQKEKTLNGLIKDQWLCHTTDGRIGLGMKSFFDLRSWFRNNDIPSCDVCNEAGVKASLCPNEGCIVRIHHYCLKKKFSQRKGSRACPGCGTEWPHSEFSDDDAEVPEQTQVPSTNSSARKRPRHVKAEIVEAETQPTQDSVLRRRLRSFKTESLASSEDGHSQPTRHPDRRTRSSYRL